MQLFSDEIKNMKKNMKYITVISNIFFIIGKTTFNLIIFAKINYLYR